MKVVFLVGFSFPYGEASSVRAFNICKLLNSAGIDVHVIADFVSEYRGQVGKFCTYEWCLDKQPSIFKRGLRAKESLIRLKKYCDNFKVDAILSNAKSDRFFELEKFCKNRKIDLFIENCEWYDISSYKLGRLDYRFYKNERMLKEGFKKVNGFISISRLLNNYNSSLGKLSVRIPTILDVKEVEYSLSLNKKQEEKINIIYAGSPGKSKELLRPIIEILKVTEEFRKKIIFHIYGPNKKLVLKNIQDKSLLDDMDECVKIYGYTPQEKMQEIIKNADFLIFIRPNRKSSHAGFPTKFGESMSVGTPVISNRTGDIDLYLKSDYNGYILNELNTETLKDIFYKILKLDKEKYNNLRKNARLTAENYFDYKKYLKEIKRLFNIS